MALLSIDTLVQPVTEEHVLENFLATLETLRIPARSWRTGGAYRTILRVVARQYAAFSEVAAALARSGFLETASGVWLTLLARNVYDVERRPATFATGFLRLQNTGGGVYSFGAGAVRALWPSEKKAYVTTEAFTLNPGDNKLVAIQAVELGSASSAPPGLIDTLETVLLGVLATNPESVVGSDEQADEDLRQMCRNKLAALSMLGPRGAYAYAVQVAKRVDGSPVDVNRYAIDRNAVTGVVSVSVASPSGPPALSDLDLIRASVEKWARPDTVTSVVAAATAVAFARTLTVWARRVDGVSAADIQTAVQRALIAMVEAYPIGGIKKPPSTQGYLYATTIEGAAEAAHPAIFAVDGVGADIPLSPGQVATLAATITVRLVDA